MPSDDRTEERIKAFEDARQRMFGYRRGESGEIVADALWDPGSREVKELMERERLRMFDYCRNLQGEIVGTVEEAVQGAFPGTESTQASQPAALQSRSHSRLQAIIGELSGLQEQADRIQRFIDRLRR